MRFFRVTIFLLVTCLLTLSAEARQFRIAVIQPGDSPSASAVQSSFDRALRQLCPPDTTFQFQAAWFRSAKWDRDSSRVLAGQLARLKDVDLILAIGPWVTEDLLEAGCTRPIISLSRTDPYLEGLSDSTYRTLQKNLTVQAVPNKIAGDIALLHRLRPFKKLGLLFFPTGLDSSRLLAAVDDAAKAVGATSVSAFGHDNKGTYAYLKAYGSLPADVDAVYLFPLWGMDAERIRELGNRLLADRRTSIAYEGLYAVDKGILISSAVLPHEAEGRFAAWKALQIFRGRTPQELPTSLPLAAKLTLNAQTAMNLGIDITLEMTTELTIVKSVQDQPITTQSLSEVLSRTFDMNPGYLAWQDRLAQAVAQARLARSSLRPTVQGYAEARYRDENTVHNDRLLAANPELIREEELTTGLTLDLPLWSLESNRSVAQARQLTDLERAGQDSAYLLLEAATAESYYQVLRCQAARSIQSLQSQLTNTTTEVGRGMVASGERPRSELTRWRAEELKEHQQSVERETDLRTALVGLNALMNQAATTPLVLDSSLLSEEAFWRAYEQVRPYLSTETARLKAINQLVDSAIHGSPRARIASLQVAAESSRLSVLRSTFAPTLGLRSSIDLVDQLATHGSLQENNPTWTVGAYLRWPILDGGRRGTQLGLTRARLSEAEYLKDQTSLRIMDEVGRLVREIAGDAALAIGAERESELSMSIVAAAVDDYSAGLAGVAPTVATAQTAVDAQMRLLEARARFLIGLYKLVCVVGWSPHRESLSPAQLLHRCLAGN